MNIKELDHVRLKDGREGAVMLVHRSGLALEVEFDFRGTSSDVRTVEISEVESVNGEPIEKAA